MARLQTRLAKDTDNYDEIDKQYAYMIFIAEKEFNVGIVTESFPMMKLWNLFDKGNVDRYDAGTKGKGGIKLPNTLGG